MKLRKLFVKEYKNLHDFDCVFSDSNITAFIGNNGSGKSNLLEVITKAFSNAKNYASSKDLDIIPPHSTPSVLNCIIEYESNGIVYELRYNSDVEGMFSRLKADPPILVREEVSVFCNGTKLSKNELDSALPDSILLYYAGETLRQKGTAENTYDKYYEEKLKRAASAELPSLRFMDYFSIGDLPLLLLTAAAYKGDYYTKFLNLINCDGINSKFSLILKHPGKGKGTADTYWGATGFVKHFLDAARKYVSGTRDSGGSQYYMFFENAEDLKSISENEYDLFAKLHALRHYGYLDHIGIELQKNDGTTFSSLRLSEGEKQLGLLLLLTTFTAQHECLYLFDEFDAYLHLNWQRTFSQMIRDTYVNGHILLTTHSPASISKIYRKDVFIVKDGKCKQPLSDTYNRAIDEIIEEQLEVELRPKEYTDLVKEFRNAILHNRKDIAYSKLEQIKEVVGEDDPFLITERIALERMK